jgi:ribosome-binding factor A
LTEVQVNKKMEIAKTGVSVIPSSKADEAMKILERAHGELQFRLNRTLNIKPMPRIHFYVDHGPENAARVEKKLLDDPSTSPDEDDKIEPMA